MKRSVIVLSAVLLSSAAMAQVTVKEAWVRATVAQQKATGAFMQLQSAQDANLVGAQSPVANVVEVHEMAMDGNVMKMRQVKDIPVPANGSVELKPGGLHLMFMNIKAPLAAGETVPVKLKFAKAGEVEVKMPVNSTAATAPMKH